MKAMLTKKRIATEAHNVALDFVQDDGAAIEAGSAALAGLTRDLSRLPLHEGLFNSLDILIHLTRWEVGEVFLQDPAGGDMTLAAHRGPFRAAFYQIPRFQHGEGYPGIIAVEQRPILTTDLQGDSRYLRSQVKEKGFHSYICVPLKFGENIVGSLNVASREHRSDPSDCLRILSWATSPLAMAIRLGFYQAERLLDTSPAKALAEVGGDLDDMLKDILRHMMSLSGAKVAAGRLFDPWSGKVLRWATHGSEARNLCLPEPAATCPALAKGQPFLSMADQRSDGTPCRTVPSGLGMVACFPLAIDNMPLGLLQLGYEKVPHPPTRDVALLSGMASRASYLLGTNWSHLKTRETAILAAYKWDTDELRGQAESGSPQPAKKSPLTQGIKRGFSTKDATTPFLDLRCLGPFQLFLNGEIVLPHQFPRRKALTLLKILAIHRGVPLPADTLAEYLWPEVNPKLSAHRLHVVISALRQVVDRRLPGRRWQFIWNFEDRYFLELSPACRLDLEEYFHLISAAKTFQKAGKTDEALLSYQAAAELYRGDLLEDDPHMEWCWMQRETIRETQLDILRRIALALARRKDWESAVLYYRQALSLDPLREELHRQLMTTLAEAGRRDEALRQYLRCRDILERELNISPAPETEAAYKTLQDSKVS